MTNGKTPGSDGLPTNFYKFFWIDIKIILKECILYAMNNGELSIEQKQGIIILLSKKEIDYIIIANILACRLQSVLSTIIKDDRCGYLEVRFIGQNIRIIEDITFFTKQNNFPGILLSINFEKAFDSVNWNVLFNTLKNAKFGEQFIGYIKPCTKT